ncbi:Beta-hexosaminidase subunit alpha [Fasciola hepatica]|uniref:Beta-hexosaminidase n=1 Tax=Fasciola hepatica TaxID=6192 RepID=A0A4E0RDG0_FASHE|nr:Beta-hexosaminidase subunit alpha [Fasciola hepatica]
MISVPGTLSSLVLLLLAVLLSIVGCAGLVPKPTEHVVRPGVYYLLNQPLEFVHNYYQCDLLQNALNRFVKRLEQISVDVEDGDDPIETLSILSKVLIQINTGCDESVQPLWPSESMIETYVVDISDGIISIVADQIWGILHGLETVLQLIFRNRHRTPLVQCQLIMDTPRFVHRGYLIDTSRHYLQTGLIIDFLEAMTMVKMNVLHWHIVDETSFPYYSYTFPNLTLKGAYDPQVYVYTHSDVMRIIHEARYRGIRVMPEFDTPGHTQCWGHGHPELLTQCFDDKGKSTGELGPIDPTRDSSYDFMRALLTEIKQTFWENFIHLGGDEVDFSCWSSNPDVKSFMEKMQFGANYSLLQSYYMEKLISLTHDIGDKRPIRTVVWQEVFDHGFRADNGTIIHVWKEDWRSEMKNVTSAGFNALLSSCWYLNYIYYGNDWIKQYNCDPADFGGTPEEIARVLGGEAAMWGEYVDDTNIFSRSWPRGAAVAERLWSTGLLKDTEFRPRFKRLRCQMLKRGWRVEPITGPGHCP